MDASPRPAVAIIDGIATVNHGTRSDRPHPTIAGKDDVIEAFEPSHLTAGWRGVARSGACPRESHPASCLALVRSESVAEIGRVLEQGMRRLRRRTGALGCGTGVAWGWS